MKQRLISLVALVASLGAAGCDLAVTNPNNPETERVLALPVDLESLLGAYWKRHNDGLYRNLGNVWGIANVQSFENYSSLANNAQNARAGIPRPPNDNSFGNVAQGEQSRVYYVMAEVDRVATNALSKLNAPDWPGFGTTTKERDWRAKSFAEYLRGMARGYTALFYDSAAVSDVSLCELCPGTLIGHRTVMDSAFASLQRALDYADSSNAAGGTGGFPLPATWVLSTTTMTLANYQAMIRSYRARLRANLARTPAERANNIDGTTTTVGTATDWALVVADAATGNAGDFSIVTNSTTGPFKSWVDQYRSFDNWHQMMPFIIGMGDTTSNYSSYIATPLAARGTSGPFFMATPDLRFPQGATRAAQQTDLAVAACDIAGINFKCKRYFRNRPTSSDNLTGLTWGHSQYDNVRFYAWARKGDAGNGRTGAILEFPKSELRLLEAEGQIVLGNLAAAVPLINASRTAPLDANGKASGGGLSAVTVLGVPAPAPGSNNCVPRVPQNASHAGTGTVVCASTLAPAASLMEALKWEKRLETHFVHFAAWFLDSRGWGDMTATTPLQWAPPYQDLMAREKPVYGMGSGTSGSCAGVTGCVAGTSASYGW